MSSIWLLGLEVRPSAKLAGSRLRGQNIYEMDGDHYVAPDIEKFYAKWGFKFRVVTEREIDPKFIRAVKPLFAYQTGTPKQAITCSCVSARRPGERHSHREFACTIRATIWWGLRRAPVLQAPPRRGLITFPNLLVRSPYKLSLIHI